MSPKYSFSQFLTQRIDLISDNDSVSTTVVDKINIPMIQRDYAQGRLANTAGADDEELNTVGQKFIEEIFNVLISDDLGKELELDFIYGSLSSDDKHDLSGVKENAFLPLDGQQRLTTLFLLYWFVGGAELSEEKRIELSNVLIKFSYATRTSSSDFCKYLVSEIKRNNINFLHREPEVKDEAGNISLKVDIITQLENLSWFHDSYKLDPTIIAMLNMLNQIQKLYVNNNCREILERLENLKFYVLPLSNFGLTEDLYVKMNARGKQLTHFENFKADLQDWIKANCESYQLGEQDYDGRRVPYDIYFINKIDNEWSNCFWSIQKKSDDKVFDSLIMRFFYRFMLNEYILNSTGTNKTLDKETDFIGLCDESNYSSFSIFDKYLNDSVLLRISNVLDRITKNYEDIKDVIQPCWASEEYGFDIFALEKLELKERAVFCAVILYFVNNDFEKSSLSDWIHVVWNIVENANIDSWRVAIGVIQLIDELAAYSNDIYCALSNDSLIIGSLQSKDTIAEERKKAKLRKLDANWAEEFLVAEKHPFFRGSISFLIPNNDSIDGFKHNRDMAKCFFDEKGVSDKYREGSHLFLRALLSKYSSLSDIKYHITDKAEKENSLKNMLSSDPVVREAIREWFALPSEEAVYTKLLEEVDKSSPIPIISNDFENKLHELLYKKTDLINWMQEKNAIRYRDNYISRPSSSYDWLFVYGYANEIIEALIDCGWRCNNRCYIGEEKTPIPFFWTAAGREIDVTKVVERPGDERELVKCSVGKEEINISCRSRVIKRYPYLEVVTDSIKVVEFVQAIDDFVNKNNFYDQIDVHDHLL